MTNLPGGVIAAVPTPVTSQGTPDIERFLNHCRWALDNGCDGLNVLGSTGEATSFGLADRRAIMEAAAANLDKTKLMVGTGFTDAASTIEMTRLAAELGFGVALVLPPFYYKPLSEDGLFNYFANLCRGNQIDADSVVSVQLSGDDRCPVLAGYRCPHGKGTRWSRLRHQGQLGRHSLLQKHR